MGHYIEKYSSVLKSDDRSLVYSSHGGFRVYLEGQGDLVSRLITPITRMVNLLIPIIHPLTKSLWPSKYSSGNQQPQTLNP